MMMMKRGKKQNRKEEEKKVKNVICKNEYNIALNLRSLTTGYKTKVQMKKFKEFVYETFNRAELSLDYFNLL